MKHIGSANILLLGLFLSACSSTEVRPHSIQPTTPAQALKKSGLQPLRRISSLEGLPEGFVSARRLDPEKKTVCAMTMNSNEEILTFQKHLQPKGFQFIELVTNNHDWLKRAVDQEIRCDILVVSGHFAGRFFGSSGDLSLEDLETQACRNEAKDLLHSAKEVFLFGCNTLAGKQTDSRTPEQYRQVLINDGFTPAQAEQMASFRYSPVGNTFYDRMSRVFSGVPRIYGFSSIGPAGATVEPALNEYFRKVNYSNYFSNVDGRKNEAFFKALSGQATEQAQGFTGDSRTAPRCYLNNPDVSESDKIKWVARTLRDDKARLQSLSEISSFLLNQTRSVQNRNLELREIHSIARDQRIKADMKQAIEVGLKSYPIMRLQMTAIAKYFGWLSIDDEKKFIREIIGKSFESEMTEESRDTLCFLGSSLRPFLRHDLVKARLFDDFTLDVVACARPDDPRIFSALLEGLDSRTNPTLREKIALTLSEIAPSQSPPENSRKVFELSRAEQSYGVRLHLLSALGAMGVEDVRIQRSVLADFRRSEDSDEKAILASVLSDFRIEDEAIQGEIVDMFEADSRESFKLAQIILGFPTINSGLQTRLLSVYRDSDDLAVRSYVREILSSARPKFPEIIRSLDR